MRQSAYIMTEEQFNEIEQQQMSLQALADITVGGRNDMIEYGLQREHLAMLFQAPAKAIIQILHALPYKKVTIE